jgi:hypothetical protein
MFQSRVIKTYECLKGLSQSVGFYNRVKNVRGRDPPVSSDLYAADLYEENKSFASNLWRKGNKRMAVYSQKKRHGPL